MTKIIAAYGTYWVQLEDLRAIQVKNDGIELVFDYKCLVLKHCDLDDEGNESLLQFLKDKGVKWNI